MGAEQTGEVLAGLIHLQMLRERPDRGKTGETFPVEMHVFSTARYFSCTEKSIMSAD